MKKSMFVVLVGVLITLFSLSGNARADDVLTFVLSNEAPGYLIDELIAGGYGNSSLYETLLGLQAASGGVITDAFLETLALCPPGSEIFTAPLSNYTGVNNPVCINADGTLGIRPIFGRSYDGKPGYVTNQAHYPGIALANFTMAESPTYYIDAGSSGEPSLIYYQSIGIAWADADSASIPTLNEWGLILLSLVLAGAGLIYVKRGSRVKFLH